MENLGLTCNPQPEFWAHQRVLLTGHTGFKGSWLSLWLERLGAAVTGFSLPPETDPSLFALLQPFARHESLFGDVRDLSAVRAAVATARPTVAIHMAAQPLVRRSYREPVETFAANVMGTVHLLDALRGAPDLKAVLVITTDKVYLNRDTGRDFVEDDPLGGDDPYSGSKAGAEMAVRSYAASFFRSVGVPVATARAGNVIGGGDWSEDRLVPDIWRAARAGRPLELRNPNATRPWQHVLDPLRGYLMFIEKMASGAAGVPPALNFGPFPSETFTVGDIVAAVSETMGAGRDWVQAKGPQPHEMKLLSLDPSAAKAALGWEPRLPPRDTLKWTAAWYRAFDEGKRARDITVGQIADYVDRG